MSEPISLDDIKKAMNIVHEALMPHTKRVFWWGWIESDRLGNPVKIGLTKEYSELLIASLPLHPEEKTEDGKIGTICGMKVFISNIGGEKNG